MADTHDEQPALSAAGTRTLKNHGQSARAHPAVMSVGRVGRRWWGWIAGLDLMQELVTVLV